MKCNVIWTPESELTFNQNIEYLSNFWDTSTIITFLDRVDEVVGLLELNPETLNL